MIVPGNQVSFSPFFSFFSHHFLRSPQKLLSPPPRRHFKLLSYSPGLNLGIYICPPSIDPNRPSTRSPIAPKKKNTCYISRRTRGDKVPPLGAENRPPPQNNPIIHPLSRESRRIDATFAIPLLLLRRKCEKFSLRQDGVPVTLIPRTWQSERRGGDTHTRDLGPH